MDVGDPLHEMYDRVALLTSLSKKNELVNDRCGSLPLPAELAFIELRSAVRSYVQTGAFSTRRLEIAYENHEKVLAKSVKGIDRAVATKILEELRTGSGTKKLFRTDKRHLGLGFESVQRVGAARQSGLAAMRSVDAILASPP